MKGMKEAQTGEGRMKRIDMERGSKWLGEIAKQRAVDGREREGKSRGTESTRVAK